MVYNTKNPTLTLSREECNYVISNKKILISNINTPFLYSDIENAKAELDTDNLIKDRGLNKNDYFDTFRYFIHYALRKNIII